MDVTGVARVHAAARYKSATALTARDWNGFMSGSLPSRTTAIPLASRCCATWRNSRTVRTTTPHTNSNEFKRMIPWRLRDFQPRQSIRSVDSLNSCGWLRLPSLHRGLAVEVHRDVAPLSLIEP